MNVGDLVRLNSGGPVLTVTNIEQLENEVMVSISWMGDDSMLHHGKLPAPCLKYAHSSPVPPDDANAMRATSVMDYRTGR